MEGLVNKLADYLQHFAYLGTFFTLFLCGVAIPLPEEPILLAAGFVAYKYHANVWALAGCAMAGVLLGDLAIFSIGRRHGDWLFRSRVLRWLLPDERLARARRLFAEHGQKVVFFGRFIAGLRFVTFFTAGNLGVPTLTFLLFDALAALITVPVSVYLAYHFGDDIEHAFYVARRSQRMLVLAIVGVIAAVVLLRLALARRRGRRIPVGEAPPQDAAAAAPPAVGGRAKSPRPQAGEAG
jgi:membrane protein DedA with SNARE-associated domain